MTPAARSLLEKLLDSWQRNPERGRKTRLAITRVRAPEYFATVVLEEKEALHADLEEAASAGTVSLDWGKGFDRHILQRITIEDGPALARYLGRPLAAEVAAIAQDALKDAAAESQKWVQTWVEDLLAKWQRNQRHSGLDPGETATALNLVKALNAVTAGQQQNLDLRTFSIRVFNDSKIMEGLLTRFCSIWLRYTSSDLTPEELMESLGLAKFPAPLFVKGPLILRLEDRVLDCSGLEPYIGLPPQSIHGLVEGTLPSYVLTIENFCSFNRHAAELKDNGIVVYTGGFPAPGVARFLKMLDTELPPSVPFYHWGDIDEGGIKISAFIQSLTARQIHLHLMTSALLTEYGKASDTLRERECRKVAELCPNLTDIVTAMLSTCPPKTLEQEHVCPEIPMMKLRYNATKI